MKTKENIFSLMEADHRKVKALFEKIDKTTERGAKTREKLYATLRQELTVHVKAEEEVLYPHLKLSKVTEAIAFESVEEHAIVKYLLDKLDGTECGTMEWTAQITVLKEIVDHHVGEEEGVMFTKMRKIYSAEELRVLGLEFESAKQGFFESIRAIFREAA